MRAELFDTHCHLALLKDPAGCISRAVNANVLSFLDISVGLDDFLKRRSLVGTLRDRFPGALIHMTAGIPPFFSGRSAEGGVEAMREQAAGGEVVAIGEIGLDYFHEYATRREQIDLFVRQLDVADELGLPAVIHARDADRDIIETLGKNCPGRGGIIHCFSSGPETAEHLLSLGLYLSFAGNITYRQSKLIRDALGIVPLDRLLLETDAPYLSPEGFRGKPNEPAHLEATARYVAWLINIPLEELAAQTAGNAGRVLGLQ